MKTSMINVKVDPKVKRDAQKIADDLGFSLSAILNASLKHLTRTKSISYTLLEPSPTLEHAIRSARKERRGAKNQKFTSAKALVADLKR